MSPGDRDLPGRFARRGAAALLSLAACTTDPPPVPLEDFSAVAMDAVCDWAVACRHMPDRDVCRRFLDPKDYDTRRARDTVAAGRLDYDPVAAGHCLDAVRDRYCLAEPFGAPACERMFIGLVPEGGVCTSTFECADRASCEVSSCTVQCCVGTCGAPGEPPPSPPPRADVGEPCEAHDDCVEGAYCEIDRTCVPMPDEPGQRCLFGCARGDLYCDTEVLECRRYAARGETCDPDGQSAPPCDPAWSFCDGVCRVRPGPGEPCETQVAECVADAFCDQGTCRERGGPGHPCDAADQCRVTCDTTTNECVEYRTCEP